MLDQLQHFLHDVTHGLIKTKKEVRYLVIVVALAAILLVSLVLRGFLV